MTGTIKVEALTLRDAVEIAKDDAGVIPIPNDGVFLDGTWEVDCFDLDAIRKYYNNDEVDEVENERYADGNVGRSV